MLRRWDLVQDSKLDEIARGGDERNWSVGDFWWLSIVTNFENGPNWLSRL